MPSRTRACKSSQALKENIDASHKGKRKLSAKAKNQSRKVLADKTNSASDNNESIEILKKDNAALVSQASEINKKDRPRRDRRLPNRFVENQVLISLSSSKENASLTPKSQEVTAAKITKSVVEKSLKTPLKTTVTPSQAVRPKRICKENTFVTPKSQEATPAKVANSAVEKSLKTPLKTTVTPLQAVRPKRICRLPSKFEDHSVSPSKFIPVQPVHASTPIAQNKVINSKYTAQERKLNDKNKKNINGLDTETLNKKVKNNTAISSSDSNNNAKKGRLLRTRKVNADVTQKQINHTKDTALNKSISFIKVSPKKVIPHFKTNKDKNSSFRVLESKKKKDKEDKHNLDVYEFTFDPSEEPPLQKKKKKIVRKKPSKPKPVIFKSNYNLNLSKALSALTKTVTKKSAQKTAAKNSSEQHNVPVSTTSKDFAEQPTTITNETNINKDKHVSIRVEDIAADVQPPLDDAAHINYSPVNSPMRPITPIQPSHRDDIHTRHIVHDDPLNLKDHMSFFDEQPVASSSMNMSLKHPHASPWRVEFENLPIRWHANSYTKPDMTPAVECSFIDFDTNKKKHVYTNIVPQAIETLQDLVNSREPNLKQTSIISFIKEKAEMSAKKKRERSKTPTRKNIFDDVSKSTESTKTPKKVVTPRKGGDALKHNTDSNNVSSEQNLEENTREHLKRKNNSDLNVVPAKTPRKESSNNEIDTFFGFDDSEDVENISPNNVNQRVKSLRPKARAVLKEINRRAGPTRAVVPVGAKGKANSEVVSKLYEEMKSAESAAVLPEKQVENMEGQNQDIDQEVNDENSESVHLFEDIELIHHLKEHRKSYGKAKKVAFRQRSTSGSENQDSDIEAKEAVDSSEEDDLHDLTFEMPAAKQKRTVHKKKQTKKEIQSKKEDKEAEVWAAGFNSMCEEVDEFPLLVE